MEKGVWLATDRIYSKVYAGQWHSWRDDDPDLADRRTDLNGLEPELYAHPDYRVYKVYADIQNPLDVGEINDWLSDGKVGALARALGVRYSELKAISDNYMEERTYMLTRSKEFIELAKSKGFDGLKATENGKDTWCVIQSADQVKLTTNKNPTADPDVRYSVSEDSNGNELSLAVQKRFANSKAVDENGNLKVLYHGTANGEFYTFDKSKGSVEGDFGSGFYFTDNESDVENNYEGGGADFENKVWRRAEQIYDGDPDISMDEAHEKAKEELYKGSHKHTVYLNIENPAIVGKTNLLDYDSFAEEYDRNDYDSDEDYESDVEYLIQDKIDEILWDIERNTDVYGFYDNSSGRRSGSDKVAEVLWNAVNEGGIDIEQLKANINNLYLEDSNGNFVGNEVTRQIIESLGYDGIIDNTVSTKFNMNLEEGTTHYIVFKPNQIKSIDNQNPTDNPDIRYSLSDNSLDNGNEMVYNGSRGEEDVRTGNYADIGNGVDGLQGRLATDDSGRWENPDGSTKLPKIFRLNPKTQEALSQSGVVSLELIDSSDDSNAFSIALSEARASDTNNGWAVTPKTAKELVDNKVRTIMTSDKNAGLGVAPDGDIEAVFKNQNGGQARVLDTLIPAALEMGGNKLDCYGTGLVRLYSKYGFVPVARVEFNPDYANDGWTPDKGTPDIFVMVHNGDSADTVVSNKGKYKQWTTEELNELPLYDKEKYYDACAYRDSLLPENIAPVKNSLSFEGEQPSTVGTPLKDLALDIAPTKETISKMETVEDNYAPATAEEVDALNRESYENLTDADAPPVVEQYDDRLTDTTSIDDKALRGIANSVRDILALDSKETKALQDVIQNYSTSEMQSEAELFDILKKQFGEKAWRERFGEVAEVKQYLRSTGLKVSDHIKADIPDYSAYRKSVGSRIKTSKDGLPVDVAYQELNSMYPHFFPEDIINESDQFQKIVEVAQMDTYHYMSENLSEENIDEAVDLIIAEINKYKENQRRMGIEEVAREGLDGIAPLKAEQIAKGMDSEARLIKDLDNYPVETVEQKLAIKIQNVEQEIMDLKQLQRESIAEHNKKIDKLTQEYLAKKDKNTKVANNIISRVINLETRKNSIEADYAKRISDREARLEKMKDPKYSVAMQKQATMEANAKWAENLLGDTSTWVDKKIGLQYATNTERRNLRDIVRDENGNKDIARADAIDDALNGQYNREEAAKNRELAQARGKYAEMKITKAEDAYIQMLGELRHNPETTLTEKVVNEYYEKHKGKIDTAKVDKIIDLARQDYDSWLQRVNAELKKQGMKEIPYRKGYFPHFTEPKQNFIQKLLNWKVQDNEIPTSIAGLTETFRPSKSWQSFDKTRHSDETDYSFTKGFDAYSQGVLDWIHHLDTLQKRRAVENHIRFTHSDEGIKARIKEVYKNEELDANEAQAQIEHILSEAKNPLNNFVQDFTTHTNILAGKKNSLDRAVEQATNRHIYSVMTNVQNRLSANMVLANVRSALTNFIPITQSWAQVSPMRSIQATKDVIANAIQDDGMIEKSTFLTNRLKNPDNLHQDTWDKVLDKAGIMFEVIDNFSSQVIWRSKYLDNIHNGMTESEAIKNADQFAENVMAGRSKGNEPTLFNAKNPLVKAFTMFQLEVNNQYGYLFKDAPSDLKTETEHWKLNLAKGYATAFVGAYVYNALLEKVTGTDAALDPIGIIEDLLRDLGLLGDDDEEKEASEVVTNLVDNVVEELPFVGGLFGGGRIPISSALPYSDDGISGAIEDISEGNWANIGKEMMNPLLNVGLPVGGGQIKKTVQGLSMFNTDEDHPVMGSYTDSGKLRFPVEDTLGNRIQAGIFGQWANENARDYIENGRTPLSEKQTQEFVDVDLPIADYWNYREGLKGLKTNAQKADYINSLDIEDWQKNLLMNNILDRKEDVDMSKYDDYNSWEEFDYANKNPDKYAFAKSVGGLSAYKTYSSELFDIKADKDANGKTINGSRKEKVLQYINNLDADYETKLILFKSEYPSDDTYNAEIINYINNREDLTYDERIAIFTELGFVVKDGYIYWD